MPSAAKTLSARAQAVDDTTLRRFSGYTMKRAFTAVQADVNATLAPHGLRMLGFSALVMIVDNPGLSQSRLAESLLMDRPNMVPVIDALEQAGLIQRRPVPGDRRALALMPTTRGRARSAAAVKAVQDHEQRMTRGLTEPQRSALIRALHAIETSDDEEI